MQVASQKWGSLTINGGSRSPSSLPPSTVSRSPIRRCSDTRTVDYHQERSPADGSDRL